MTHRSTHVLVFALCMVAGSISLLAQTGSSAYENTAVDIKGVRHTAREYRDHRPPWNFADRIKWTGPAYPFADRQRFIRGAAFSASR
jgi:hypothetical protein